MEQWERSRIQPGTFRYEAKIHFIEDIFDPDYLPVIAEKVKSYEVDGWKACLDGRVSPFKMLAEGKYLVFFLRLLSSNNV